MHMSMKTTSVWLQPHGKKKHSSKKVRMVCILPDIETEFSSTEVAKYVTQCWEYSRDTMQAEFTTRIASQRFRH